MAYGGIINKIVDPFNLASPSAPNPPTAGKVGQDFSGLLDVWLGKQPQILGAEQQFNPQYAQLAGSLLPGGVGSVKSAVPGGANLLDQLTQSAGEQLGAGANLDPALLRITQQAQRGAEAARGMGHGPSDVVNESAAITGMGNQLQQQRQGFASGVAGLDFASLLNPAMQLTQGASAGGVNPASIYDIFNTSYNARAASNIAGANNAAASQNSY
jgi:hypothetical protein